MSLDSRDRGRDVDPDDYRPRRNTDRSWIAPTILAAGTFVAALAAAWTSLSANQNAIAAKTVAETTGKRVDGRMEEMLALARAASAAKATLEEKAAQQERESADAVAVARPPRPASNTATAAAAAQAVLDTAAKQAKKIVDDAAIEAEKLLAEERGRK